MAKCILSSAERKDDTDPPDIPMGRIVVEPTPPLTLSLCAACAKVSGV